MNFLTLLMSNFVFLQHLVPKAVRVTAGRFMSCPDETGQERNDFLPPTFLSSLSSIKHWYPSKEPPPRSPQPTHCSLTQTSISAWQKKKEKGRDGGRKGWTKFFERSEKTSPTPFGKRRRNSKVSFLVFSSIYSLRVCRWALEWNETMQESDCGWCPVI